MKTIGLIGGMSWESTLSYYKLLNEEVKTQRGGLHSAKLVLYSVDFAPVAAFQSQGKWEEAAQIIQDAALRLERAGAEVILLCTNTMHKILPLITPHISTPFLHIADATALALKAHHKHKPILLGTRFTMQEDFYKKVLATHGIDVVVPNESECEIINTIIYDELCLGNIKSSSQRAYLDIIERLSKEDTKIDSVILGCTEIGLLLHQENSFLPLFDTTLLHAKHAVKIALSSL